MVVAQGENFATRMIACYASKRWLRLPASVQISEPNDDSEVGKGQECSGTGLCVAGLRILLSVDCITRMFTDGGQLRVSSGLPPELPRHPVLVEAGKRVLRPQHGIIDCLTRSSEAVEVDRDIGRRERCRRFFCGGSIR